MKIRVWSHDLKRAIEKAEKIAAKKTRLEILEHLLLTATGDAITLTASNLTSWITVRVDGEVLEPGLAILQAENLKLIKKCSDKLIIYKNYSNIVVEGTRKLEFTQTYNSDEFPESNHVIKGQKAFSINASEFKNALKIKRMASKEEIRPQLNSANIRGNRIMALDGYRLGVINLNVDNRYNGDLMIPLETVEQLDKIIGKKDDYSLEFTYQLKQDAKDGVELLTITGDEWVLTTRVRDGGYMDIDRVIPQDYVITTNIIIKPLIESLKFFKNIKQRKKDVMTIKIMHNSMRFTKQNEKQKVSETFMVNMNAKYYIESYTIGCNDRYLQDALQTIDTDEITIRFAESNVQPFIITNEDETELYLIMPIRIAEAT